MAKSFINVVQDSPRTGLGISAQAKTPSLEPKHHPRNRLSALNFTGGWFQLKVAYDSSVIRGHTPVWQTDQPRQPGEEQEGALVAMSTTAWMASTVDLPSESRTGFPRDHSRGSCGPVVFVGSFPPEVSPSYPINISVYTMRDPLEVCCPSATGPTSASSSLREPPLPKTGVKDF